jgi:hypothetical protein
VSSDLPERVRKAAARVLKRAKRVRIDAAALSALAAKLQATRSQPQLDPAQEFSGESSDTVAFILALDAINFGSGYFPYLAKRPGLSGYRSVATSFKECWEADGSWDARRLAALSPADCARLTGQELGVPEIDELMSLYARALTDLGEFLLKHFGGDPTGPVSAANHSAVRLAEILTEMPFYRDVSRYDGFDVPFYKRAQLTPADLAATFEGKGYGAFSDLDRLTIFADNLVPHVLRREGVLVYDAALASRIDAGELIEAGSAEEVEIRAGAVHAIELCVAQLREAGVRTSARELDTVLWTRGQLPEMKAHPRHRTRTTFY